MGVTAKLLALHAEDPVPYLDAATKKKMSEAHRMIWRKFQELAFEDPAVTHWREAKRQEADNIDVGPVTEADLHDDLLRPENEPF